MLLFVQRMVKEKEDLEGKLKKLVKFIETPHKLSNTEKDLLTMQRKYMELYLDTLKQRIRLYN